MAVSGGFKETPVETFSLDTEIDATDQMEKGNPEAVGMGTHPQLAAPKLLPYHRSSRIITNIASVNSRFTEIEPPAASYADRVYSTGP